LFNKLHYLYAQTFILIANIANVLYQFKHNFDSSLNTGQHLHKLYTQLWLELSNIDMTYIGVNL